MQSRAWRFPLWSSLANCTEQMNGTDFWRSLLTAWPCSCTQVSSPLSPVRVPRVPLLLLRTYLSR